MIKKKQVNLKNKPKMIFDISSKKRYKTYEPQSNVTYHKKKLEKIQREKKTSNNTDDGGQAMGEEMRHTQMSRLGKDTCEGSE